MENQQNPTDSRKTTLTSKQTLGSPTSPRPHPSPPGKGRPHTPLHPPPVDDRTRSPRGCCALKRGLRSA